MSWTRRHPFDNVVPMFREQPTAPDVAKRPDIEGEARELTWRLLDLADRADPAELGYLAWRTMQTANDIAYKAGDLLDVAGCRSPAGTYSAEEYSDDPGAEVWEIDITYPAPLREAA